MARPVSSIASPLPEAPWRNSSRRRAGRAVSTGSRSSSRNGRRNSIADNYPRRSFSAEPEAFERGRRALPGATRASRVRRWDGNKRSHSDWDSMRRDPELWFPNANCLVHLYAQGQSRRGASIRLSVADFEASNCMLLFEKALGSSEADSPGLHDSSSSDDGGYFSNPHAAGKHELYIPAPADLSREDAFDYHLTTRNFFAWMFDLPLVGVMLGESLMKLQDRMNEYRPDPDQNLDDMLAYIESQGYSDFRDCPDHALAALKYAEKYQLAELWTDAFVHCAGQNDSLVSSQELQDVSRTTKALITRASLEMNVRLERSSMSLSNFMEDELSGSFLRLPDNMMKHVERFRSFLHSFYVQKHGYWPPHNMKPAQGKPLPLPKHTLLTMYTDFRNLFEFIADQESAAALRGCADSVYGGVDIAQAVSKFNLKKKFSPLPHALPLLPATANMQVASTPSIGINFFSRFFSNKKAKVEQRSATLSALTNATNVHESKVMNSPLVREYARFEREFTTRGEGERLSAADARKARWLVVYAQLQTLVDVTRAPEEVCDIEGVDYPLCCQTAGTPPWAASGKYGTSSIGSSSSNLSSLPALNSSTNTTLDIPSVGTPRADSPLLPSPTISQTSAQPAPLNLDRVATNKRLSIAQSTLSAVPTNNSTPSLSSTATPQTELPPPPPIPASLPAKPPNANFSTTFLIPRAAPTPAPAPSDRAVSTRSRTASTSSKSSRPFKPKRSFSDRLTNTTLGLIFAPQPVRPMAYPDDLLAGEEKFAIATEPSLRAPSVRSSMAGSIRTLRTTSYLAASESSTSIAEIPEDAFEEEATPVPSRFPTPKPSRTPAKINTVVGSSAPPPLSDSPPGLSPSGPARAGSDGSGSPSVSEAETPTSTRSNDEGFFAQDPPSPSIYGDDDKANRFAPSVLDLGGMMGRGKREDAEVLARGWRDTIHGGF